MLSDGFIIEDFQEKVYELIDFYNFNSIDDFATECQIMQDEIKILYNNIFMFKYTSVFGLSEFIGEYEKMRNLCLDNSKDFPMQPRF